jgi:hypothetical protein
VNAPVVSLKDARAERAQRALQQNVRQEFGALLGATYEIWMKTHQHMAQARERSAVQSALNHCKYNLPLRERELKAVRDTLLCWLKTERNPGVLRGLECCLELIARDGKHLMGHGTVERFQR